MSFLLILYVHFFALLTPGPDFLLVSTYALKTNFKKAFKAALGISLAIFLWIILTLSGLKFIFKSFPLMQVILSLLGVFYLFYLAFTLLKSLSEKAEFKENFELSNPFINGFLTNITNVKALFYFGSVFSSLSFTQDILFLTLLIFFLSLESLIYFSLVASFFSNLKIKTLYLKCYKKIDFFCALVFICLAFFILIELYRKWLLDKV